MRTRLLVKSVYVKFHLNEDHEKCFTLDHNIQIFSLNIDHKMLKNAKYGINSTNSDTYNGLFPTFFTKNVSQKCIYWSEQTAISTMDYSQCFSQKTFHKNVFIDLKKLLKCLNNFTNLNSIRKRQAKNIL